VNLLDDPTRISRVLDDGNAEDGVQRRIGLIQLFQILQ
jgi:hypothetical protein